MRFIVLRSSVTEKGQVVLEGLASISQKPSGVVATWIDFSEATTNCLVPEKCDLLSFTDKDELEQDLELWDIAAENIAVLAVNPEESGAE